VTRPKQTLYIDRRFWPPKTHRRWPRIYRTRALVGAGSATCRRRVGSRALA
jgi:hypothetical protein